MSGTHYGIIDGLLKRVADTEKERDAAYAERDLHIRAGELMAQEIEKLRAERDDYYERWNDCQEKRMAAEAKVKKLRRERDDALTFLDNAVSKAPEPLKALGKYLAGRLDEDEWPTAEHYLNAAAKACADHTAAEAKVEKLRGALAPFGAVLKDNYAQQPDDLQITAGHGQWDMRFSLRLGDFRRAAALTTEEPK